MTADMLSPFQIQRLDDTEFRNHWARAYIREPFLYAILIIKLDCYLPKIHFTSQDFYISDFVY